MKLLVNLNDEVYNNFVNNEYTRMDVIAVHNALMVSKLIDKRREKMSEIIRSDDIDLDDPDVRTHTKVEQVRKQWSVIIEGLNNGETLAFVYPIACLDGDFRWSLKPIDLLPLESIKEYIKTKDAALVKITHYDIPTSED